MSPVPIFRRGAELARLLGEVADVDWRNPLWWALVGSAAAAEPLGASADAYLSSDAEPSADTFMAFPSPPARDAAAAIADAIALARAAVVALRAIDGELPEQPLARTIERTEAGARAIACDELEQVAFVAGERAYLAHLGDDHTLAIELARALRGEPCALVAIDPDGPPAPAAIAAIIGDEPIATARHAHRRAWSRRGGPWLGVARAGDHAIVSTCHLIVDGYGHAWIASRIARALGARRDLARAAASIVDGAPGPVLTAPQGAEPLGIAWRRVDRSIRFPELAHALGRVLHDDARLPHARCSPTFQVPVAPGAADDVARWRRRVVPALLSVRFSDGSPEPLEIFAERARDAIAREASGVGLMARLAAAARAVPAPLAWKRRAVGGSARPSLFAPAARVLGGRACLSILRAGPELDGAPPLAAASSAALPASRRDPHGSCVLTVIDDAGGAVITASGSGATGTAGGAADLLDRWLAIV
ncbi:MAG TPA: hypothetical protein VL463_10180 [Kofleriaceae bacterium]|nr:hypothetical protein [Kofleriaceae bacterium]